MSLTEKSSFSKILLVMIFMWWGLLIVDLTILSVLLITAFRSFKEMVTTGYARHLERPWFLMIGAFSFCAKIVYPSAHRNFILSILSVIFIFDRTEYTFGQGQICETG